MSEALYNFGGLRFWTEEELELREAFQLRTVAVVKLALLNINPAWQFFRMEGPCLTPRSFISPAYNNEDLFATNHKAGEGNLYLRAETTPSTYAYAKHLGKRAPICVYQAGKSFRREQNDGASAAKLRFNEFWQLEFQCIYANSTKADYCSPLLTAVAHEISRFTMLRTRIVPSDRLPAYSEATTDIEAEVSEDTWREIASCSIRTDYDANHKVCEMAIGLCRVAALSGKRGM